MGFINVATMCFPRGGAPVRGSCESCLLRGLFGEVSRERNQAWDESTGTSHHLGLRRNVGCDATQRVQPNDVLSAGEKG